MARSIFYRTKLGPGPFARASDDLPFEITSLTGGATYEIEPGDGTLIERTPTAANNLLADPGFDIGSIPSGGPWDPKSGWSVGGGVATRSTSSASGNLFQYDLTLAQGTAYQIIIPVTNYVDNGGQIRASLTGASEVWFDNAVGQGGNGVKTFSATAGAANAGTGKWALKIQGISNLGCTIDNLILRPA